MSTPCIQICPSSALINGGLAHKLPVKHGNDPTTAVFIRYQDQVYGYLNRCPHMGAELDWENSVFTRAGDLLMCARHGATFTPDTGECTGGPCRPSRLTPLKVSEESHNGQQVVLWWPEGKTLPAES
jgi:nitrite reductase/ring-hydroxylating ferredoxin subunit